MKSGRKLSLKTKRSRHYAEHARWQEQAATFRNRDELNEDLFQSTVLLFELYLTYMLRPYWDRCVKRAIDLSVAVLVLAALTPLFVIVGLAIRLNSPGPVFYRQIRVGRFGVPFLMFKFRTMRMGSQSKYIFSEPMQKLARDPRTTAVGTILRNWRIDELPQLLNVILGDMSLVGPRPLVTEESSVTPAEYTFRLAATPGLTGLWQALHSNRIRGRHKLRLDSFYARNQNIWLDLRLIFATIPRVLRSEANAPRERLSPAKKRAA